MRQHIQYPLILTVTSRSLILSNLTPAHGDTPLRLALACTLTVWITLAIFGALLWAYRSSKQHGARRVYTLAGSSLFCLFAASLGVINNIVQFGITSLFGLTIGGVVVAGATAGVIVAVVSLLSPLVLKLPLHRQAVVGTTLFVAGSLLALIQMAITR